MNFERKSLLVVDVMWGWRPGSYDTNSHGGQWSWTDEILDLHKTVCSCCGEAGHYQQELTQKMFEEGAFWEEPPILGNDGRVWDGHHRIIAAMDLRWKALEVEVVE